MDGPFIEIRVKDSRGNTIKQRGEELSTDFEFDTLDEALENFTTAVDMLKEEFRVEDGDEEEEVDDVEEIA